MKAGAYAALVMVLLFDGAPVLAGTLAPELAALLAGKSMVTRARTGSALPSPMPFGSRVDSADRVQVYVHPATGTSVGALAAELPALGARDVVSAPLLRLVQAWVPIDRLPALAGLSGVQRVGLPAYVHMRSGRPRASNTHTATAAAALVLTGLAIDSQAPAAMQAPVLIANGANGAGVKVGASSGDISGLAASQAAGYLPAAIWTDPTYPGTNPIPGNPAEGTALLEIVHAVAPQASLGFCAPATSVDLLTCFKDFINWGATVIVNDMQLPSIDMFAAGLTDDNSVAWAAEQLAAAHPGVAFVNIAGNEAQDYFQAPYTPGPGATLNGTHYASLMDFGTAAGGASATRLAVHFNFVSLFMPVLEWNDPLHTTADSFVMALVNAQGTELAVSTPFTTGDGRPGVSLSYVPADVGQPLYLEIACQSCVNPVTLKLDGFADGAATFALNTPGSLSFGQAVIPGTLTVAAASVLQTDPLSVTSEIFSGRGPFLYGDFGATGTLAKPDISGVDNVVVSGAGGFDPDGPAPGGGALFLGTSAAVPNVAGLLADILSGNPGLPASEVYAALENTANRSAFPAPGAASAFDPAQAGAGLVQGVGAWNALSSRTIPYILTVDPPSAVPGSAFELQVSGAGFMPGASVDFNGTALPTTSVSSTVLTAQVPIALTSDTGVFKLLVTNPNPANSVSNTLSYVVGNPVPEVLNLSPQEVTAGSAAFALTVQGTNFFPGAVVMLNHVALVTRFVSATELTAMVPAAAVRTAGDYPLVVDNGVSGGSSTSVDFLVQAPAASKSSGGRGGVTLPELLGLLGFVLIRRRKH